LPCFGGKKWPVGAQSVKRGLKEPDSDLISERELSQLAAIGVAGDGPDKHIAKRFARRRAADWDNPRSEKLQTHAFGGQGLPALPVLPDWLSSTQSRQ
jgi:hypothetical protein